jgi:hypothetical protein
MANSQLNFLIPIAQRSQDSLLGTHLEEGGEARVIQVQRSRSNMDAVAEDFQVIASDAFLKGFLSVVRAHREGGGEGGHLVFGDDPVHGLALRSNLR